MHRRFGLIALSFAVLCCRTADVGPSSAAAKTLTLTKEVAFGSSGTEDLLVDPNLVVVDPHGTTYIADRKHTRLFAYDSAGKLLRSFGREGKGPGEFEQISFAGWAHDTLWVLDNSLGRLSFVDSAGSVTSLLLPSGVRPEARFTDGAYAVSSEVVKANRDEAAKIGSSSRGGSAAGGRIRIRGVNSSDITNPAALNAPKNMVVRRVRPDGTTTDTLARYTCSPGFIDIQMSAGEIKSIEVTKPPITDCPYFDADDRGDHAYFIRDLIATKQDSAAFTVTAIDADGKTRWTKRFAYNPVALTDSVLNQITIPPRADTATALTKAQREGQQRLKDRLAPLKFVPTVSDALVGNDGTLLLRRETGADNYRWTVLAADGTVRGNFTLPAHSMILEVDASHIWVSEVDANEDVHVIRYRIGS